MSQQISKAVIVANWRAMLCGGKAHPSGRLNSVRVIFSRKGFDSDAGGCPSPIIDGEPISLPIPVRKTPSMVRYVDLIGDYGSLVEDLTKGRIDRYRWCHLDPDIKACVLPRQPGWRGALGQAGKAQSHLSNKRVILGDLYLFWGLFRHAEHTERWKFYGPPQHRLFGWLQIGEILELGEDGSFAAKRYAWLRDHPHVRHGWSSQNVLYVASEEVRLDGAGLGLPGWGVFRRGLKLTADGANPSIWSVPDWLNPARGGVGMTYHKDHSWSPDGTVTCAGRGQEFVADIARRTDALLWLSRLFETCREGACAL
jgi:hypothetical protein